MNGRTNSTRYTVIKGIESKKKNEMRTILQKNKEYQANKTGCWSWMLKNENSVSILNISYGYDFQYIRICIILIYSVILFKFIYWEKFSIIFFLFIIWLFNEQSLSICYLWLPFFRLTQWNSQIFPTSLESLHSWELSQWKKNWRMKTEILSFAIIQHRIQHEFSFPNNHVPLLRVDFYLIFRGFFQFCSKFLFLF